VFGGGIRLYAGIAAFLALSGFAFSAHRYVHRLQLKAARVEVAERSLVEERRGRAADRAEYARQRKVNEDISNGYQADLRRLALERDKPLPRLVCKSAPRLPASSGAAPGIDAGPTEHVGQVPEVDTGRDVSDRLLEYGIAAEANQLQLLRLQEWVRIR
jgi:hypothetical protein